MSQMFIGTVSTCIFKFFKKQFITKDSPKQLLNTFTVHLKNRLQNWKSKYNFYGYY